jgi:protein-disulfide isomerase
MRLSPRLAIAAGLLVAAGAFAGHAQTISGEQRGEIERIVREYLIRNPEVLQEAIAALEKKQAVAEAERHKAAVKENAQLLFNSKRHVVVGNPQGDVNFVEFFDYNCGYCKRALEDMMTLMKADPKLRVVLKEFPVLGPASVDAARVGVAVRMQDKTGKKYLEFHQKLLTGRGQVDRARAIAAAREVGLDVARIERDMSSEEARASLEESMMLAERIGLNGTPSYVIGDTVVVGAVGLDALKSKVNEARCGKSVC